MTDAEQLVTLRAWLGCTEAHSAFVRRPSTSVACRAEGSDLDAIFSKGDKP
jgi:hypothetical protein